MAQSAEEAGTSEQQQPQPQQQQPQQQPHQRRQKNLAGGRFGSGRLLLFVTVLVIELTIFFLAMAIPMDATQQKSVYTEGQQIVQSVKGQGPLDEFSGIFLNNVRIALIEAVPFVRPGFLGYSLFYSGEGVQGLAVFSPPPVPPLILGGVLFLLPHSLVEITGFAVSLTAGIMRIWAGVKKRLRIVVRGYGQEGLVGVGVVLL